MRVLATNRPFNELFKTAANAAMGRLLFEMGNGQWDIPGLRELLEKVLPEKGHVANFPLEHNCENLGRVKLQINAHRVGQKDGAPDAILLSINLSGPPETEQK